MSPAFPSRRRAEQFEALLEGTVAEAPTAELAELLALAGELRALPEVAPRPEFAAALRERLMSEAPAALAAGVSTKERLTVGRRTPGAARRERRIGLALAAFSLVGATTASAVAAQSSLPGDTLYPVKRLLEDARTTLAMGDEAKADLLLSHADERLDEVRALGAEGADARPIEQALADYAAQADQASDLVLQEYAEDQNANSLTDLQTFTQHGVTTISELTGVLPMSVDDALAHAAQTLVTIDQAVTEACPACGLGGLSDLPSTVLDLLSSTTAGLQQSLAPAATGTGRTAGGTGTGTTPARPEAAGTPSPGPLTGAGTQAGEPVTKPGEKVLRPSSTPTSVGGVVGGVGDALRGVTGGLGDTVGGVGDSVGGPVGDVLGGVGGTVGQVGGALGDTVNGVGSTLDGVLGGLLGGTTASPTPKP